MNIMSSTFFAAIYSGLITPLVTAIQAMTSAVCSQMGPYATTLTLLCLAVVGGEMALEHKSFSSVKHQFAVGAFIIVLIQAANYSTYISNLFITAIPNSIGQMLGSPSTNPASALDNVLNTVVQGASNAYGMLSPYSLMSIPLGIAILMVVVVSLICLVYSFGIFVIATILNILLVAVGPIFLCLAIPPLTRKFAFGWFSALIAGCVAELLALATIQAMATAELTLIKSFLVAVPGSSDPTLTAIWGLVEAGLLLGLTTLVVKKIPEVSQAIAGGIHSGSAGLSAATFGAGAALGKAAKSGVSRGAGAAVGAAVYMAGGKPGDDHPWRGRGPVGRSLSRGDR
jgi:type IV secretion system protein VirB6